MEKAILDNLMLNSKRLKKCAAGFKKKRYLFEEMVGIDPEYYIGVKGVRGVGKSVLILQLTNETEDSVYFSADSSLIKSFSIYEVVKGLIKRGFKNIFIDEVHRKKDWDVSIKSIYDEHEVRIIFSGSSALNITKTGADLSRRVVLKELKPVSFREFLNIRKEDNIEIISFNDIIKNKISLNKKYGETYQYFEEYLEYGGVLYQKSGFFEALENSIKKVILQDLSALRDINLKYETDAYKLLYLIARSPPFETNYSSVARELEVSKTRAIRLVKDLESSGLIICIMPCQKKGINIKKEPKIY